jgi:large subunit ribosomal protein L21
VYAIVRCGGRQERASVDEVLTVDRLAGEAGTTVTLPVVLVVDDGKVISDHAELGEYQVTAEILGPVSGPKINMIHFKNKTRRRRRQGHRQKYTQVRITGIGPDGAGARASGSRGTGTRASASRATGSRASAPGGTGTRASASRATGSRASASGGTKAAKPRAAQASATGEEKG